MKAFKAITDPRGIQLMADETRRRIIYLLRAKEMTVAQLAEALNLTPQAVYHHIRKLKEVDLVEIAKEERVGHLIETYYRASAEMFHFTMGKGKTSTVVDTQEEEAIRNLPRLGFNMRIDPETVTKVLDLMRELKAQEEGEEMLLEKIGALDDIDFLTKQSMEHYGSILGWTDQEFSDWVRILREQRKLLQSMLVKEEPLKVKSRVKARSS